MWVSLALICTFVLTMADETTHSYEGGDRVVLWYSKLGPINNP
jgi:hypothetical protein